LHLPAEPIGFSRSTGREVYQIIHEALANVRKHAKASDVEIGLEEQDGIAQLVISDDGCGFPEVPGGAAEGGANAWPWSIHERVRALGGSLKVESSVTRGARLLLEIPVPKSLGPRPTPN
jgi:signal transduction histidine kinase